MWLVKIENRAAEALSDRLHFECKACDGQVVIPSVDEGELSASLALTLKWYPKQKTTEAEPRKRIQLLAWRPMRNSGPNGKRLLVSGERWRGRRTKDASEARLSRRGRILSCALAWRRRSSYASPESARGPKLKFAGNAAYVRPWPILLKKSKVEAR